jgi:hypothetical protein
LRGSKTTAGVSADRRPAYASSFGSTATQRCHSRSRSSAFDGTGLKTEREVFTSPARLRHQPDVAMEDLSEALGCDAMRGTSDDVGPFLGNAGPPFTSVEVEKVATLIEMDGFSAACTSSCALSTRAT